MYNEINKLSVIGLGYIGLPTAALFASQQIKVSGVDIDENVVRTINKGEIHIVEPDLDWLVKKVVESSYLKASKAIEASDAFIIAVPTPFKENHVPDLSFIKSAVESISSVLQEGNLIVLESTSPVGTTELVEKWLIELCPHLSFPTQSGNKAQIQICYCPERVLPGKIINEMVKNDRIIGGLSELSTKRASRLYKKVVEGNCIETSAREAELCKLIENSFRDINIAFANELSIICDKLDIDVWNLIKLANKHPRVNILQPGPGVGGHCIAVDPWFIIHSAPETSKLIKTARYINDNKPLHVLNIIKDKSSALNNPIVACFGLSFKENIDDLRESPSVEIVEMLAEHRVGKLLVVEPNIKTLPAHLEGLERVKLVSIQEALLNSNIVVMLVKHDVFRKINKNQLDGKTIIDACGVWQ